MCENNLDILHCKNNRLHKYRYELEFIVSCSSHRQCEVSVEYTRFLLL
jgi:hypothetical protein